MSLAPPGAEQNAPTIAGSRLGVICSLFSAVALIGCTTDTPVPILVEVDDDLGRVQIAAGLFDGSCPDVTALDEGTRFELASGVPLPITEDTRAVAVWAVDSSCAVVGFGCERLEGSEDIIITVRATSRQERCDGACEGTRCGSADAGGDDTGEIDSSAPDSGELPCSEDEVESAGDEDSDGFVNADECCRDAGAACEGRCVSVSFCVERDSDLDGIPDYLDSAEGIDALGDADEDGITNEVECCPAETSCCDEASGCSDCVDSDLDGSPDYLDLDSDDDGVSDSDECPERGCADPDEDGFLSFRDRDSDNDGIADGVEEESTRTDAEACAPMEDCNLCACPERTSCFEGQCNAAPEMLIEGDLDCMSELAPVLVLDGTAIDSARLSEPRCPSDEPFLLRNLPDVRELRRDFAVACRVGVCVWRFDLGMQTLLLGRLAFVSEGRPIFAVNIEIESESLRRLFPEIGDLPGRSVFGRGFTHYEDRIIRLEPGRGSTGCGIGGCP